MTRGAGRWCAVAVLVAGCSTAAPQAPTTADPAGAMAALPPCEEQPAPPPLPDVPGLTLPDEATVYSVYEVGPLTQAEGVVEMVPVDVRTYYESRDDLQLLSSEDEIWEAEILVSDGSHRMFVKAQALCETASNFNVTIGPESEADAVPTPPNAPVRDG